MDSSHFGVYQQTLVDSSEISIRTFVPGAISTEPYRKELITKKIQPDPDAIRHSFRVPQRSHENSCILFRHQHGIRRE